MSYQLKRIAIFASGEGTNAENLISHFKNNPNGKIVAVLTNRPDAGVIHRAEKLNVRCEVFSKEQLYDSEEILQLLQNLQTDWIVLAGFLLKIPVSLIRAYPGHIVNIHPALLPSFGGKGMYGMHVHESVIRSGEKESGISIHLVNEHYDNGKIIFQAKLHVNKDENPYTLANRIHELEYKYYPEVIEKLILSEM